MKQHLLTNDEKNFISPIFLDPTIRARTLYEFGQQYLKNLNGIPLQEKTYALFQYILDKKEDWKGDMLVPLAYRHTVTLEINSITYSLREFIGWSILYPKEVDTYFEFDINGNVLIKEIPILRLVDKDKYKIVKKIVKNKELSVKAKKELDTSLNSGFSLFQKDDILNIVIACYIEVTNVKNKKMVNE